MAPEKFHEGVGNWGIAIILLTFVVKVLRIDPRKLIITLIADGLPTGNGLVGVGPAAVDFSTPLFVTPTGDIYLATAGRGIVQLKKTR